MTNTNIRYNGLQIILIVKHTHIVDTLSVDTKLLKEVCHDKRIAV